MVTARGFTTAVVVILLGATAWGQSTPKAGGMTRHGIHAFDWKVRIVEPDGTIDDLPMPNRNHGDVDFGPWTCTWKLQATSSPTGKINEQYAMQCESRGDYVGMRSAVACDKRRPTNLTMWTFGGSGVQPSTLTATCSEGADAVTWAKHVDGPPVSGLRKTGDGYGKARLGSWDCDWTQVQTHPGPSPEDRFEIACANPASGAGDSVTSAVVSAWCGQESKPSDEMAWDFLIMGQPTWNGSAFAMSQVLASYRVTASCSDGSPRPAQVPVGK
jgi:hypothetical protein